MDFLNRFSKECAKSQVKNFQKGEIITTYLVNRNQICFLIDGSADLIRYESNGTQSIIEHFENTDLFGEIFYSLTTNNELFVLAKKNCKVLFFSYDNFHKKCKKNCKFHETLVTSLPDLIFEKIYNVKYKN